jgi:hypothetical protein
MPAKSYQALFANYIKSLAHSVEYCSNWKKRAEIMNLSRTEQEQFCSE